MAEAHWAPYPKSASGLSVPNLKVDQVTQSGIDTFSINVSSDQVAVNVWIEAVGIEGFFDQNAFLLHSPDAILEFTSLNSSVSTSELQNSLQIRSYKNSYVVQ